MQLGIDEQLVGLLGKWSSIPVTYAGGARTLVSHIWRLVALHCIAPLSSQYRSLSLEMQFNRYFYLSQADLERVRVAGNGRVDITVGSALDIFGGKLAYDDVVVWHKKQQTA